MVSNVSNSLAALLLNPYAQAAIQAAKPRDAIDPIKPGATVTARYSVEDDGSLALRDVDVANKVNETADSTSGESQRRSLQQQTQRDLSFADLAKPKATLSPSDEVALFAVATPVQAAQLQIVAPKLVNGASITDVETEEPSFLENDKVLDLVQQKQLRASNLYARNNDITYNIDPAFSEAA